MPNVSVISKFWTERKLFAALEMSLNEATVHDIGSIYELPGL